jgi:hypothetical protein
VCISEKVKLGGAAMAGDGADHECEHETHPEAMSATTKIKRSTSPTMPASATSTIAT